jgi:hypothetical protein
MHALVFRITIHNPEEADKLLNEQFVPGARRAPGFVTGWWVELPPNGGTSVIVFESEAAAKAAAAQAPRPETDAVTLESFTIGKVVAHA